MRNRELRKYSDGPSQPLVESKRTGKKKKRIFGSVLAGVKVLKPHGQHDQMNGNAVLAGMTEKHFSILSFF